MTLFTFAPASVSVPGLQISISITVEGTLADLPTISYPSATYPPASPPTNFGTLEAFSITSNAFVPSLVHTGDTFTLADFSQLSTLSFISPQAIGLATEGNNFQIIHLDQSIVEVDIGAPSGGVATGVMVDPPATSVLPEPSSFVMFVSLLVLGAIAIRTIKARNDPAYNNARRQACTDRRPQGRFVSCYSAIESGHH